MEKDKCRNYKCSGQRADLHRGVLMTTAASNSRKGWEQGAAGTGILRVAESMASCNRLEEKQFDSWICCVISFSQMAAHPHP